MGLKLIIIFIMSILSNLAFAQQLDYREVSWKEWKNEILINDSFTSINTYFRDTMEMKRFLKEVRINLIKDTSENNANDSIESDLLCLYSNDSRLGCFNSSLTLSDVISFNAKNEVIRYYNRKEDLNIYYLYYYTILDNIKKEYQFDSSIYIKIAFNNK